MAGSKRERELHREKIARQQKEAAQSAERRRRFLQVGGAVAGVLVVVLAVVGIAVAGNDDSDGTPAATQSTDVPAALTTPTPAASDAAATAKVKCTAPSSKQPSDKQYQASDLDKVTLNPDGTYVETMTTNCGEIKFNLDTANAPTTSKEILFLSDQANFFDNTSCHRLTTSGLYVLQCGDPKGDGTGGPGFTIPEENLPEADGAATVVYPRGTIAMGNTGVPNSTSSQFFIVYKDSPLPPSYTVLGSVTSGMQVVDYVAGKGVKGGGVDGTPNQPLKINKMVASVSYPAGPTQ